MVKVHKRKKNSRIRGARTCGWGFRQKHKGHGNKGGFGMSGTGKRADHKKQKAKESDTKKKTYFGKQGLTSRGTKRKHDNKINLFDIKSNLFKNDNQKIDLKNHTILGTGEGFKAEITAKNASKSAIEKMQNAGGKIILPEKKQEKVEEKAVEESKKEKTTEKKADKEEVKKEKSKEKNKEDKKPSKPKKAKK